MPPPRISPTRGDVDTVIRQGNWFDSAGLGVFIHWDAASQAGWEISWPMVGGVFSLPHGQDVTAQDYHALSTTFDPQQWDARAFARQLAACGARYAVLTAKHHNGFALFDTHLSDHSVMHSPYGRDIVREFTEALHAEGLRVGLYISLSDWHHPDYPAWRDDMRPYVLGVTPPRPDTQAWTRYRAFLHGQVRELLSNYGRIDTLWFDGGWERTPDEWDVDGLDTMIRQLQPDIMVNDRLPLHGDYATPEQFVPSTPLDGRWETCMTMNESWGYNPSDTDYKSVAEILCTLVEVRSRGGNLLLNVSPTGNGSLPTEQVERMTVVADWMSRNGESVREVEPGLEPWQFYGPSTRSGPTTYAFLVMHPVDKVTIRGVRTSKVIAVRELGSGRELAWGARLPILEQLMPDPVGELSITVPEDVLDPYVTVLVIEGDQACSPRDPEEERRMLSNVLGRTPDAGRLPQDG